MPGPATCPKIPKRHGEGRKGQFITRLGTCEKRQSKLSSSSAIFHDIDISYILK
jgi:hypothetical protein